MSRRALVTGGAGFIGSYVVERFISEGWSVDVVDDLSTGKRENLHAAARFHECDVRSPAAAKVVLACAFDVVVHLAAQMDVRRSVADPVFDAGINILGLLNVLEAIRRSEHSTRVVFSSTGGVIYGDLATPPNRETTPKEPDSPYAIAKLSSEYYLAYYSRIHGIDTVSLRYGNVYGPRQDPHGEAGVVAIFCGRILDEQPLTIFGDGKQTRDYVHVADVADATFRAATTPAKLGARVDERTFNVGTGRGTTVLEVASTLLRVSASNVAVQHAPQRRGEQQHSFLTVDKARDLLGWTPRVMLEAGLAETFRWFAARAERAASSSER